jgi:hypothetical protein
MIMILVRKMGTLDSVVNILLKRLKCWKTIDILSEGQSSDHPLSGIYKAESGIRDK